MNRKDIVALRAAAEAVAAACQKLLTQEAQLEWEENESAATWRGASWTASAHITQRTMVIEDDQKFLAWLGEQSAYSSMVTSKLVATNADALRDFRVTLAELVATRQIQAPPGSKLDEGGAFSKLVTVLDGGLKRRLAAQAWDDLYLFDLANDHLSLASLWRQAIEERK
jgi:hypothetical protein